MLRSSTTAFYCTVYKVQVWRARRHCRINECGPGLVALHWAVFFVFAFCAGSFLCSKRSVQMSVEAIIKSLGSQLLPARVNYNSRKSGKHQTRKSENLRVCKLPISPLTRELIRATYHVRRARSYVQVHNEKMWWTLATKGE